MMASRYAICVVGVDLEYARTRVLCRSLALTGAKVIRLPLSSQGKGWLQKQKQFFRLMTNCRTPCTHVLISSMNHGLVPSAWFFCHSHRKKLLFDPLISQWDTIVCDRKLAKAWSVSALRSWIVDYLGFHLPDCVLCDTEEHRRFYTRVFGLSPRKSVVVPVGAEESLFFPSSTPGTARVSSLGSIQVLYYGGFSPLHGMDLIVRAASALREKPFEFTFVGQGQDREMCEQLARGLGVQKVKWIDQVAYQTLGSFIRTFDIGLGIFGSTAKVRRVIPNKVYQMIACGLPVLTLDTPAMHEVFDDGTGVVLVPSRTVTAVADGLQRLWRADARKQVAALGLKAFADRASESVLAGILASALG